MQVGLAPSVWSGQQRPDLDHSLHTKARTALKQAPKVGFASHKVPVCVSYMFASTLT